MSQRAEILFTSRDCRLGSGHHRDCAGIWEGPGVLVKCECECHTANRMKREGKSSKKLASSDMRICEPLSDECRSSYEQSPHEY